MLDVKAKLNQSGFTLVEMTVVVTVMATIGVVFIGLISNYFIVITRNADLSDMTITSQNLLRSTENNILYGNGVEQSNQNVDPNQPAGWNTSESNFVIILAVPAENSAKNYIINPLTGSPYMNELVYYKNGTTLMERRLANPLASVLGDTLITSCPPANATPQCPADIQLAQYVNSMTFSLFDIDGDPTTTPSAARSILINLNMQRDTSGQPINLSTSLRVTLRNQF